MARKRRVKASRAPKRSSARRGNVKHGPPPPKKRARSPQGQVVDHYDGVVGIIVLRDEKTGEVLRVFMEKNPDNYGNPRNAGMYRHIGGFIDPGENDTAALLREFREEAPGAASTLTDIFRRNGYKLATYQETNVHKGRLQLLTTHAYVLSTTSNQEYDSIVSTRTSHDAGTFHDLDIGGVAKNWNKIVPESRDALGRVISAANYPIGASIGYAKNTVGTGSYNSPSAIKPLSLEQKVQSNVIK